MEPVLRAADLTPEMLAGLLGSLRYPEGHRVRTWLEGIDGWSLDFWPGLEGRVLWYGAGRVPTQRIVRDLLTQLVGGRVFDLDGELRWRRLPALGKQPCRTVYLGKDFQAVNSLDLRGELAGKSPRTSEYPLWGLLTSATCGRTNEPEWVELRIPHRFRYPVQVATPPAGPLAVKAVVETWVDGCGEPHFSRLCDLRPTSENNPCHRERHSGILTGGSPPLMSRFAERDQPTITAGRAWRDGCTVRLKP